MSGIYDNNDATDYSKIKVAIRIRPLQEHEINGGHDSSRFVVDKNTIRYRLLSYIFDSVKGLEEKSRNYKFD
jgi:hypothetical protein